MSVRDDTAESRYEIDVDGEVGGFLVYRDEDGVRGLVHTEVKPEHEGHGVGTDLVRGVLEDARSNGTRVRPYCSFVVDFLQHHPEYRDVVA